jgi:L-histidine N-alpha-methyltransferase
MSRLKIFALTEPGDEKEQMARDIREALLSEPKDISPWPKYFYDAEGSRLFEQITELPEYYQTRTELSILTEKAPEVVAGCREIVELGSGSAKKTRALLDAALENGGRTRYVPLDVSESALRESGERLLFEYPDLEIRGYVGDFDGSVRRLLTNLPESERRVVIFLGGTIGNFDPVKRRSFLRAVSDGLRPGDRFLLGADLVKDTSTLVSAYDDAAGVTARFNKNILKVINERLGADFDPALFSHRAIYDADAARVEMRLRSEADQEVNVREANIEAHFAAGEEMRTEVSAKFTEASIAGMFSEAGLSPLDLYTDDQDLFGLALGER